MPILYEMEPNSKRLDYLDGLRALAVLSVIAYHAVCFGSWSYGELSAPMHASAAWFAITLLAKGAHGVDLFFVISGFCLSYPTLARIAAGEVVTFDLSSFFAKRATRIAPPYFAAIVLASVAVTIFTAAGVRVSGVDPTGAQPLFLVRQALFLDRGTHLIDGSFWTLFVEVRWYLAFPLLLALYVANRRAFVALLVALVVAYNFTTLHAVDVAVLPAFMLGIVAADWHVSGQPLGRRLFLALYAAFAFALLLEPVSSMPDAYGNAETPVFASQSNAGWQLTCFLFVVAAGQWSLLRRALSWRPLSAIGVASYGIYLVHQPVVAYWEEWFGATSSGPAALAGAFAFSLLAGAIFYALVEAPLVSTRMRAPAVAAARRYAVRLEKLCGIPERFTLRPAQLAVAALTNATVAETREEALPLA